MRFDIFTIFPRLFDSVFSETVIGKALGEGIIDVGIHDIRQFAQGKHRVTDDLPYGGGPGMVMKPEPICGGVEEIVGSFGDGRVILFTPTGRPFTFRLASELSREGHLILICGRYEGIDERVTELLDATEISIGDYVLTGGEFPAMVVVDAVSRFIPGVVGDEESVRDDSFELGFLEGPHYTRPATFRERNVPEVLLSGNHEKIREFRLLEGLRKTLRNRPDLLEEKDFPSEIEELLDELGFSRGKGR